MRERSHELSPERIGYLACQALLMEADTQPKPGLVCPHSCGSHTDMDHALFVRSAEALQEHFVRFARLGRNSALKEPPEVLPLLRSAGLEAEEAMFATTGGINTHKGAIFSLGLLTAAASRLISRMERPEPGKVAQSAAAFVQGIVEKDLAPLAPGDDTALTAGERLFLKYRVTGIRGEAEAAYPSAMAVLGTWYQYDRHHPLALALPQMLLRLMAQVQDSNVLHRGGPQGLETVHREARAALAAGGMYRKPGREQVAHMEREFVRLRLSPGGSADLLAVVLFLHMVSQADPILSRLPVK